MTALRYMSLHLQKRSLCRLMQVIDGKIFYVSYYLLFYLTYYESYVANINYTILCTFRTGNICLDVCSATKFKHNITYVANIYLVIWVACWPSDIAKHRRSHRNGRRQTARITCTINRLYSVRVGSASRN